MMPGKLRCADVGKSSIAYSEWTRRSDAHAVLTVEVIDVVGRVTITVKSSATTPKTGIPLPDSATARHAERVDANTAAKGAKGVDGMRGMEDHAVAYSQHRSTDP